MANIENEYLVKRGDGEFATIASLFGGVRILKMDGFLAKGKPINIYTAQWINNQKEDYIIASATNEIFRENVDIDITFIVSDKYGASDVRQQHDAFVSYMVNGALYIKSNYVDRVMECVCLKEYNPTTIRLKRPSGKNYIIGTITLHTLNTTTVGDDGYVDDPYGSTTTINTTNVYDTAFGEYQDALNQRFNTKSDVKVSVSGRTLVITTRATQRTLNTSYDLPQDTYNANNVYDAQLGQSQSKLNNKFDNKTDINVSVSGRTLNVSN